VPNLLYVAIEASLEVVANDSLTCTNTSLVHRWHARRRRGVTTRASVRGRACFRCDAPDLFRREISLQRRLTSRAGCGRSPNRKAWHILCNNCRPGGLQRCQ
jgi:hypothetical protein